MSADPDVPASRLLTADVTGPWYLTDRKCVENGTLAWVLDYRSDKGHILCDLLNERDALQAEVQSLRTRLAATTRPDAEALVFGFVGSFDSLAASFGWYDHGRYRWFVYPADEAAALDAIRDSDDARAAHADGQEQT